MRDIDSNKEVSLLILTGVIIFVLVSAIIKWLEWIEEIGTIEFLAGLLGVGLGLLFWKAIKFINK